MWLRVVEDQRSDDTEGAVTWQVEDGGTRSVRCRTGYHVFKNKENSSENVVEWTGKHSDT
jgi:hypothetical protein